jgi:hypothetical protein
VIGQDDAMRTAVGTSDGEPADDPEWLVLVPRLPTAEAVAAWSAWQLNPDTRVPLDEVTIDVFRGEDGQEWSRYRVGRAALRA